jgi:hypothetical protein
MRFTAIWRQLIVAALVSGMVCAPWATAMAADSTVSAAELVNDVALTEEGTLSGQVVNRQGAPLANVPVRILYEGYEVAKTTTDERGTFQVTGLRGGVHVVATDSGASAVRLWTSRAAPPAARPALLLTSEQIAARGQLDGGINWNLVLGATLLTGIAVSTIDDDPPASGG